MNTYTQSLSYLPSKMRSKEVKMLQQLGNRHAHAERLDHDVLHASLLAETAFDLMLPQHGQVNCPHQRGHT